MLRWLSSMYWPEVVEAIMALRRDGWCQLTEVAVVGRGRAPSLFACFMFKPEPALA